MYSMNKFWLFMRKTFVTFMLILTITSLSFFSGCFFLGGGGDDGGSSSDNIGVDDLLYGIRVTYQRQGYDSNKNIVPVADEDFVKSLMTQYLNISVEVLASLAANYGKGITDFDKVVKKIPNDLGDVTITEIKFAKDLPSSDENYCAMVQSDSSKWRWAEGLRKSDDAETLAASFCNVTNLFKMEVALCLINMGNLECSQVNGDTMEEFNTVTKEKLEELMSDTRITHSSLVEKEIETFSEFVLNNVVGSTHRTLYEQDIKQMIKEIFEQEGSSGKNGEKGYKYPVVASLVVKDYSIKDISLDKDDEEESKDDEDSDDDDEDSSMNEFFSMAIGQQYYKSIVLMPKTSFKFSGLSLIFESTEDVTLKVVLRIHEKDSDEFLIDEEIAEIHITPGAYDDLEENLAADFELEINTVFEEKIGIPAEYYEIDEYNKDTDVQCYINSGSGSLLGDLLDIHGRPLIASNNADDITLASLYKVTKESTTSVAVTAFEKLDSSYIELSFETVGNKPFNIGYIGFDYED